MSTETKEKGSTETAAKEGKEPIVMTPKKPEYNPALQYTWDPEAKFTLTGREFGLWLNTVRGIVASKEAMEVQMAMQCNEVIEGLMKSGVEAGIIKEIPPAEPKG